MSSSSQIPFLRLSELYELTLVTVCDSSVHCGCEPDEDEDPEGERERRSPGRSSGPGREETNDDAAEENSELFIGFKVYGRKR